MPLVKDGAIIADSWIEADADGPVPETGDVLVSFDRLEHEADDLVRQGRRVGVVLPNTLEAAALAPYLDRLDLIVLELPKFSDGRAFSQAHQLSRQLGFKAEIRARGHIVPDQVAFLRQCGVETFALDDRFELDEVIAAATSMSLTYQSGYVPGHGYAPAEVFGARASRLAAATADRSPSTCASGGSNT